MGNFQRPTSGWLCLFSLLWVAVGFGFGVKFAVAGNWVGAGLMLLFGVAGIGLWFQSRLAAWVLLAFALFGIINVVIEFSDLHWTRIGARLCFAVYAISLLADYLKESRAS